MTSYMVFFFSDNKIIILLFHSKMNQWGLLFYFIIIRKWPASPPHGWRTHSYTWLPQPQWKAESEGEEDERGRDDGGSNIYYEQP
jgi:hypothetical protein